MSENLLKKYGQPLVYKVIHPLINLLVRWKVSPNTITTIGLLINALAAGLLAVIEKETAGDMLWIRLSKKLL